MADTDPAKKGELKEQSFVSHLVELRNRIIKVLICVAVVLLALMPLANQLYLWLAEPLLAHMGGSGTTMIATEVASPFFAPFKLAVFSAVVISVPYIFYHAWAFIAPGLYQHERRLAFPLLLSSTALFYAGMAFAYLVVFPVIFGFFHATAPAGVQVMTDISRYLDFVLKLFLAFGIAFEVPIATYLTVRTEISTREDLRKKRPYIIIGAFIFAALLTPPDPVSQALLALPILLLFEFGLMLCKLFIPDEAENGQAVVPTTDREPRG